MAEEDVYICPAGERLAYHYTNEENGLVLRRYWSNACQNCAIKCNCTTGKERRITRSAPCGRVRPRRRSRLLPLADGMIAEEWAIWDQTFIPQLDGIG